MHLQLIIYTLLVSTYVLFNFTIHILIFQKYEEGEEKHKTTK